MKSKDLILLLILVVTHSLAQDVIRLKSGNDIRGKVVEISNSEVKYKKEKNHEGPVYVIPKKEIYRIQFRNGEREIFDTEFAQEYVEEIKDEPTRESQSIPNLNQHTTKKLRTFQLADESYQWSKFWGPRIGLTFLGPGVLSDSIQALGKAPVIFQFGWQFEVRIFTLENGTSGLFEFIPMIGGIDKGMFLPSATVMFGIRGKNGFEFAFGPNLSMTGFGLALATGYTIHREQVNFPINIAFIPSVKNTPNDSENILSLDPFIKGESGFRLTLTVGFNLKKK
jgi:hypothetical protein